MPVSENKELQSDELKEFDAKKLSHIAKTMHQSAMTAIETISNSKNDNIEIGLHVQSLLSAEKILNNIEKLTAITSDVTTRAAELLDCSDYATYLLRTLISKQKYCPYFYEALSIEHMRLSESQDKGFCENKYEQLVAEKLIHLESEGIHTTESTRIKIDNHINEVEILEAQIKSNQDAPFYTFGNVNEPPETYGFDKNVMSELIRNAWDHSTKQLVAYRSNNNFIRRFLSQCHNKEIRREFGQTAALSCPNLRTLIKDLLEQKNAIALSLGYENASEHQTLHKSYEELYLPVNLAELANAEACINEFAKIELDIDKIEAEDLYYVSEQYRINHCKKLGIDYPTYEIKGICRAIQTLAQTHNLGVDVKFHNNLLQIKSKSRTHQCRVIKRDNSVKPIMVIDQDRYNNANHSIGLIAVHAPLGDLGYDIAKKLFSKILNTTLEVSEKDIPCQLNDAWNHDETQRALIGVQAGKAISLNRIMDTPRLFMKNRAYNMLSAQVDLGDNFIFNSIEIAKEVWGDAIVYNLLKENPSKTALNLLSWEIRAI